MAKLTVLFLSMFLTVLVVTGGVVAYQDDVTISIGSPGLEE